MGSPETNKPGPTLNPHMGRSDMASSNRRRDWGFERVMCCPGHTAVLAGWDQSPVPSPAPAAHGAA